MEVEGLITRFAGLALNSEHPDTPYPECSDVKECSKRSRLPVVLEPSVCLGRHASNADSDGSLPGVAGRSPGWGCAAE